jgi:DNA-binding PadR family transcriptional regulator
LVLSPIEQLILLILRKSVKATPAELFCAVYAFANAKPHDVLEGLGRLKAAGLVDQTREYVVDSTNAYYRLTPCGEKVTERHLQTNPWLIRHDADVPQAPDPTR